jgi:hypothetical protein
MSKFNKLSRAEMKNVTGGNPPVCQGVCSIYLGGDIFVPGDCITPVGSTTCVCLGYYQGSGVTGRCGVNEA